MRRHVIVLLLAFVLTGCATAPPAPPWRLAPGREHPLTGRIWDVAAGRFVEPERLVRDLGSARFVLLGESHDHVDHHRLEAWLVERLLADGRRRAVAFEMLPPEHAETIARQRERAPRDAAALGAAVDWARSGWPDFAWYAPIVQAALDAGVPIVPANLTRADVSALRRDGAGALGAARRQELGLDRAAPPGADAAAAQEIRAAHCGRIPDAIIPGMSAVQRARDAAMAASMAGAGGDGAVLIAGRGHVRTDRAVPFFLRARQPDAPVASVAFVEVRDGWTSPAAYAPAFGGALPFDWIWFTPVGDRGDPCARMGGTR